MTSYVSTTREDPREWRNVIFAKHTITGTKSRGPYIYVTLCAMYLVQCNIVDHTSLIVGGYSVLRLNYQVEDRA